MRISDYYRQRFYLSINQSQIFILKFKFFPPSLKILIIIDDISCMFNDILLIPYIPGNIDLRAFLVFLRKMNFKILFKYSFNFCNQ